MLNSLINSPGHVARPRSLNRYPDKPILASGESVCDAPKPRPIFLASPVSKYPPDLRAAGQPSSPRTHRGRIDLTRSTPSVACAGNRDIGAPPSRGASFRFDWSLLSSMHSAPSLPRSSKLIQHKTTRHGVMKWSRKLGTTNVHSFNTNYEYSAIPVGALNE